MEAVAIRYVENTSKTVALQRDYIRMLGGDHRAALMLSRIFELYSSEGYKFKVSGDDWWFCYTHVDWNRDLYLTRHQSRRSLDKLEEFGIIVIDRFARSGMATGWLRLVSTTGVLPLLKHPAAVFPKDFVAIVTEDSVYES